MLDLIVRNGRVVAPGTDARLDVGVRGGTVVELAAAGSLDGAATVVDATGKLVFPGFVDAHVHVGIDLGEYVTNDGFAEATAAAAFGGSTTVVDFAVPDPGEAPTAALERKRAAADGEAHVDYAFHGCVTGDAGDRHDFGDEVAGLVAAGAASVKAFMVYPGRLRLTNGELRDVLGAVADAGGLALVHAEDQEILDREVERRVAAGETDYPVHPETHPGVSETTAMWTVADLVAETGCPTYFVHVSTGAARHVLEHAAERGLPLLAETCPHYLVLDEGVYERDDGERFVCSPPIRPADDAAALWDLVDDGLVRTVNSDHCAYDSTQKREHRDDVTRMPNGLPGVETKNTVFYGEAVGSDPDRPAALSLDRFVALTSTNAAKMLGLYPRKGTVSVGADADLVVFDPDASGTLAAADLHMATDYTPFEGADLDGAVDATIRGGEVVVADGELVGEPGDGAFVRTAGPDSAAAFADPEP